MYILMHLALMIYLEDTSCNQKQSSRQVHRPCIHQLRTYYMVLLQSLLRNQGGMYYIFLVWCRVDLGIDQHHIQHI